MSVRDYSSDDIRLFSSRVKELFEKHRNWERKEVKCTPSAAE